MANPFEEYIKKTEADYRRAARNYLPDVRDRCVDTEVAD